MKRKRYTCQSGTFGRSFGAWVLFAVVIAGFFPGARAKAQAFSVEEKQLRDDLQKVYREWSQALREKNYPNWAAASTSALKIEVKNQILAQKMPFPRTLFESPMAAPQVSRLRFVRARAKGDEAQAIYFGRVDIGGAGNAGEMPENLLVLWFGRENGSWRVGQVQLIDLDPLPVIRRQIKGLHYGVLDTPEFAVDGKLPPVPREVAAPDFVAKVFAVSLNEKSEISINGGVSDHEFKARRAAQTVIGGLKRGENTIRLTVSPLAEADKPRDNLDNNAPYVVRLYLMPDDPQRELPVIVWRHEAEDGKVPTEPIEATFVIDDAVLRQRFRQLGE